MTQKLVVLPGDGVGPEIVRAAMRIWDVVVDKHRLNYEVEYALIGGAAIDQENHPLPPSTLAAVHNADAVLLGAVGGPQWSEMPRELRPEKGLLTLRNELGLFSNLRPAIMYPQLASASSLKPELVAGLDLMIVRELTGGIYFGEPRGVYTQNNGQRYAINTMHYTEAEIARIAHSAFKIAEKRHKKLCSVDKANVLEVSELWRDIVNQISKSYPDVELTHLYVDNAAMQLVRTPKQFDVMVTSNLFGDILSDCAAMLTGSIGMLPSASLAADGKGLYEPVHGSAPDIAGQGVANPLATVLSLALLLRYSFNQSEAALTIEKAVQKVLERGLRTPDIVSDQEHSVTTECMTDALIEVVYEE